MEENARELISEYDELYDAMAASRNTADMKNFGEVEKHMFHHLAKHHPELAEKWVTRLKASKWHNYMSKAEAEQVTSRLVNQSGMKGPHWDYPTFKTAVESIGGKMEDMPYYNCYALWTVANMRYSDNAVSASEFVPKDQMPKYFYSMAVENLKDPDRPRFVRDYFDL